MLAAGERSVDALRKRLGIDDGSEMAHVLATSVVREIGENRGGGIIELRKGLWREVCEEFKELDSVERGKIKMKRMTLSTDGGMMKDNNSNNSDDDDDDADDKDSNQTGGGGSDYSRRGKNSKSKRNNNSSSVVVDSSGDVIMKISQIENELDIFDKEDNYRSLSSSSAKAKAKYSLLPESSLRKKFSRWYPTYRSMIAQMNHMKSSFDDLDKQFRDCRSHADRAALAQKIQLKNDRLMPAKKRLEKYLPIMHQLLRDVKQALCEHVAKDKTTS